VLRFRVIGFPVRVEPLFFVLMGMFGLAGGREGLFVLEWIVVAGFGILVHELGHAVAFRRFGSPAEIVLHGFGGFTTGNAQPPRRSIVVSLAGPFTGFAFGGLALWLYRTLGSDSELVHSALSDLIFVTVVWGVFNLLPILPLDGGNVVASALKQATGGGGQRAARVVSLIAAAMLAGIGIAMKEPYLAMIAAFFGFQNWQALAGARDEPALERLRQGRAALLQGDADGAAEVARKVTASRTSARVQTAALELQAWAHLAASRPAEADTALHRLGGGVSASQLVRTMAELASGRPVASLGLAFGTCEDAVAAVVASRLVVEHDRLDQLLEEVHGLPPAQAATALRALQLGLHHSELYREAARVGEVFFGREADGVVAYNVACSWACAGDAHEALSWLSRAVDLGWRDTAVLDADPNFDLIRTTDGFQAVRAWIQSGPEVPEEGGAGGRGGREPA
jgi:Zn-dependent protease